MRYKSLVQVISFVVGSVATGNRHVNELIEHIDVYGLGLTNIRSCQMNGL